jgi:hypothetical protein
MSIYDLMLFGRKFLGYALLFTVCFAVVVFWNPLGKVIVGGEPDWQGAAPADRIRRSLILVLTLSFVFGRSSYLKAKRASKR